MNEQLISVIVLIYNSEKYIKKCLDSILNQTYKNLEIIVVNDGSTDKSEEIIKEYMSNNRNIKLINRTENKGTMYSRCEGYENANGEYIMFVDSDDWIDSTMLEKMYTYIIEYKTDLVKCNYKICTNESVSYNKKIVEKPTIYYKENFEPELYDILYDTIYCNSIWMQLIKKDKLTGIKEIDKKMIYGEDLQINLLLLKNINSILLIPDYLYNYYHNSESITNQVNLTSIQKKMEDALKTYNILYNYVDIFDIKNKEKYKKKASIKIAYYLTTMSLKLFSCLKSNNDMKNTIIKIRNQNINIDNKKIIFNELKKKNIIFAFGFKLLMKDNLSYFNIYSKVIYKPIYMLYKVKQK